MGKDEGIKKWLSLIKDPIKISVLNDILDLPEDKICKEFEQRMLDIGILRYQASKASLQFLYPLYVFLTNQLKIPKSKIFLGLPNLAEFKIYYTDKNFFRYDFVDLESNVIIEFDGKRYHPRVSDKDWKHPFIKNITKEDVIELELKKEKIAEDFGFKVIRLYEGDNKEINISKIDKYLKEVYVIDNYLHFLRGLNENN